MFYFPNNQTESSHNKKVKITTSKLKKLAKKDNLSRNNKSYNTEKSLRLNTPQSIKKESLEHHFSSTNTSNSDFGFNNHEGRIKLDYSQMSNIQTEESYNLVENNATYEEKLKVFFKLNLELPNQIALQVIEASLNFEKELSNLNHISDLELKQEFFHETIANYEKYLISLMGTQNYNRYHLWSQQQQSI